MMTTTKVLHVDDCQDIRVLVRMSLEVVGGMQVIQFSSGPEALAAAADAQPDILLLDVMMPEMSGPELLEKLRTLPGYESIPAAFLTAKASEKELESLRTPGVSRIITKPFDALALAEEVAEICRDHQASPQALTGT